MIPRVSGLPRRGFLMAATLLPPALAAHAAAPPAITVWKDPGCGCCSTWVQHLRGAGFPVAAHDTGVMDAVKRKLGVPEPLQSCHTATVDGYVLEGHVPAEDIRRLLADRPRARGLAVPGMPASAPGMDIPGEPYTVTLFGTPDGDVVFARHSGAS